MQVWDPLVRVVHWTVALLVVVDLVNDAGANPWHRNLGYAAGGLVVLRLAWGLCAPGWARLSTMAGAAGSALPYVRSLVTRRAEMHTGHNPLGACMAFLLWTLIVLTVLTGWLLRLEAFWGDERVELLHAAGAYTLAGCALVHVAGVLATSALHRVNLVAAMVTGRKRLR